MVPRVHNLNQSEEFLKSSPFLTLTSNHYINILERHMRSGAINSEYVIVAEDELLHLSLSLTLPKYKKNEK